MPDREVYRLVVPDPPAFEDVISVRVWDDEPDRFIIGISSDAGDRALSVKLTLDQLTELYYRATGIDPTSA